MPKKDYAERKITLVGRTKDTEEDDACPVCKEADDYLSSVVKHDNRTTYKKIEVDSEEGEGIADEKGIKSIPYIEDCKTFKEGGKERTRCRTIEGYSEDDWSDFSKLVEKEKKEEEKKEKEVEVQEEKEANPSPKIDEESGIEEPEEPSEPV